ncbi:MAG: hypothetical protein OSA99_16055 [Acidimicrobiales bacterium]|nr:hypothetical protein [Acidimicrobiales bacterium]
METADTTTRAPAALTVVLVLVTIETIAEVAFVIARDDYGPGGKALVGGLVAMKIFLAISARRLQAGGALGLLLFELVGILVAIGAAWSLTLRLVLVACVITVYVLVLSSLHAFPTPEIR